MSDTLSFAYHLTINSSHSPILSWLSYIVFVFMCLFVTSAIFNSRCRVADGIAYTIAGTVGWVMSRVFGCDNFDSCITLLFAFFLTKGIMNRIGAKWPSIGAFMDKSMWDFSDKG